MVGDDMPRTHLLPLLPFERISKRAGAARLSREAAEELREVVEELATAIAERATRAALHAGRKTVTLEDIEFVAGKISRPEPQQQSEQKKPQKAENPTEPQKDGKTAAQ